MVNLVAPEVNEEIFVDLHPKSLGRDEYFKDYQDLTGAALASVSSTLSRVLDDCLIPLSREEILKKLSSAVKLLSELFYSLSKERNIFLVGRYEERIQKSLKNVQPTSFLFSDNLKSLIETSKAMERVSKDLKIKSTKPQVRTNPLNWRSFNTSRPRTFTSNSRFTNNSTQSRGPAKRSYNQTQPHKNRQ